MGIFFYSTQIAELTNNRNYKIKRYILCTSVIRGCNKSVFKLIMKVDVLLGLQWGDEGKGKIVDVLTPEV